MNTRVLRVLAWMAGGILLLLLIAAATLLLGGLQSPNVVSTSASAEQSDVIPPDSPATLPVALGRPHQQERESYPVRIWSISAWGENHAEALSGQQVYTGSVEALAAGITTDDEGWYNISRTFVVVEIPESAEAQPLSLEMPVCSRYTGLDGEVIERDVVLAVHLVESPVESDDPTEMWDMYIDPPLAQVPLGVRCEPNEVGWIGIDLPSVEPGTTLRLVLRDSEDAEDQTGKFLSRYVANTETWAAWAKVVSQKE